MLAYLEGNVYFKVTEPKETLRRAMVQFRLVESIERQEAAIRALLRRPSLQGGDSLLAGGEG